MLSCRDSQLFVRRASGRASSGFTRLIGTPFHPVENFKRQLDIVIAIQPVPTICTLWFEKSITTLPHAASWVIPQTRANSPMEWDIQNT